MRLYSDLLPSYLDGENIQKHSGVIERSDKYIDGLVELFGLWDKLERPILIKREQILLNGWNKVTIYINTPTPITEIIIEGDIEETITPEDTLTTSYTNTWTIYNPSIDIIPFPLQYNWHIKMPLITVTVRTETHNYTKAYPENDTIENNSADHDIFLDIVGGLLGIPRRKYAETDTFTDAAYTDALTPPFMAKEAQIRQNNHVIILPCMEDDYYYKERLDYFINTTDNLRLFRTIYDKDVTILKKEDNIIPAEFVGTETTVLFTHIQKGAIRTRNNLNIDTTNIQQIAEQSLPITRPVQIYPYATLKKYDSTTQEEYVNRYKLHLTLGLDAKTIDQPTPTADTPIANLPVNISYADGTELGTFITDETGTAHISIDGARSGLQTIHWDLTREYPYFNVNESRNMGYNASLFKLSLSDGAWQYKKYFNTSVTDFETPSILDNDNLNCGRGMIAYTPAINPTIVDLTDYTLHVKFHHTTGEQRILLGTLGMPSEDTARIYGMNNVPRNYESSNPSITDTHTFTYQFTNGVCSLLFDGVDTGVTYDFSNTTDMIYIAGVNNRADGAIRGLHFEEIRAGYTRVSTTITSTTLNSTTGSASVKATLTSNGTGISGATIQCKNGTTTLTSGTTDSNGECTFDLSSLQAGSYTLTIEYTGDTTHSPSTATHSITITDTPVTLNLYGKGQTTGWSSTQWTTIEINAAEEAHCNYTKRNAILKQLPLTGDFTLVLHIQASHNTTWNWGLIPSQSDYSNPAMKVSKGDTLNNNTSIATMFDHGSGVWDTTVEVTITRSGTTYTLEYNGNSYTFTGSTDTLYLWMDKTGSGNLFLTYIETSATMQ